jgi:hypothetical protein
MNEEKDNVPQNDTKPVKRCENCAHYNVQYPPPFCIDCRTGWNDDYTKPDFYKPNNAALRIEKAARL